ncbi:MAG: peptidase, partial [Pseudomonadota bacterium]
DAAGDEFSSIENLNGSNRSDRLTGTDQDNTLRGRDDNDTLIGGAGDDALGGEFGNDRLIGQTGDDTLFGGPGSDSIVFDDGDDVDLVFGFEDDIDTLVLTRDLVGQRNASQVVADFAISFGGSTVLNFGGGDQIELRGFANRNDLVDDIDIV